MRYFAAPALALLLLAACGTDDDGTGDTTTTSAPTTTEATTTTTTTSPGDDDALDGEEAAATVRAWVSAIAEGDLDAAWELTAEPSRRAVGDDGLDDLAIELAEGWGAWGHGDDVRYTPVSLGDLGGEPLAVVLLEGRIPQEGPPEDVFAALAVRGTADGPRVDPFVDLGVAEHDPVLFTEIAPTDELAVFLPVGRDVRFVPGHDPAPVDPATTEGADGDQERHVFRPAGPLPAGPFGLAVVVTDGDQVMVRTVEYVVVD